MLTEQSWGNKATQLRWRNRTRTVKPTDIKLCSAQICGGKQERQEENGFQVGPKMEEPAGVASAGMCVRPLPSMANLEEDSREPLQGTPRPEMKPVRERRHEKKRRFHPQEGSH